MDILLKIDHPNIIGLHYYFYTFDNEYGRYLNMYCDYMGSSFTNLMTLNCIAIYKNNNNNINLNDYKFFWLIVL